MGNQLCVKSNNAVFFAPLDFRVHFNFQLRFCDMVFALGNPVFGLIEIFLLNEVLQLR